MKMRRVIVSVEIETDATAAELESATVVIRTPMHKTRTIRYLEKNRVNVVRSSTAKRGKVKEKAK